MVHFTCQWCGVDVAKPFGHEGMARFCSLACSSAKGRVSPARKRVATVMCAECGVVFRPHQTSRAALRFHNRECFRRYFARPVAERERRVTRASEQPSPNLQCQHCGVPFYAKPSVVEAGRRFCSDVCYWAAQVTLLEAVCTMCGKPYQARPGRPSRFCSRTCQVESWRKPTVSYACEQCGKVVTKRSGKVRVGRFCSRVCVANATWRASPVIGVPAAIRLTTRKPYERPIWIKNAGRARKRDGYTCQSCGVQWVPGTRGFDVHHIIPIRLGGSDKLGNLTTLCRRCHRQIEHRMRLAEAAGLRNRRVQGV
jgi:5-methylcytosine-specific restriction protein A